MILRSFVGIRIFILLGFLQIYIDCFSQDRLNPHVGLSSLSSWWSWSGQPLVGEDERSVKHVNLYRFKSNSEEVRKMGYLKIDNQLQQDQNVYLMYNYEWNSERTKARIGLSMNNTSMLSVSFNHSFSVATLFEGKVSN